MSPSTRQRRAAGRRIPGTAKTARLDEDLGALAVQPDPADIQEIENGFAQLELQGARPKARAQEMSTCFTSSASLMCV